MGTYRSHKFHINKFNEYYTLHGFYFALSKLNIWVSNNMPFSMQEKHFLLNWSYMKCKFKGLIYRKINALHAQKFTSIHQWLLNNSQVVLSTFIFSYNEERTINSIELYFHTSFHVDCDLFFMPANQIFEALGDGRFSLQATLHHYSRTPNLPLQSENPPESIKHPRRKHCAKGLNRAENSAHFARTKLCSAYPDLSSLATAVDIYPRNASPRVSFWSRGAAVRLLSVSFDWWPLLDYTGITRAEAPRGRTMRARPAARRPVKREAR